MASGNLLALGMKHIFSLSIYCFLALLLSCQTGISQSDPELFSVKVVPDLAYYTGEDADPDKHKLDLYLPDGVGEFPTVLWIHGGAWIAGGRKQEEQLARRFAERGVGMAVISYRLSPGTWANPELTTGIEHPEHIRDCVRALKWVIDHAEEYGINSGKLIASGYSAGGHLSALMAADPSYLEEAGLTSEALLGAVPVAGAYDMVAYYESHLEYNGKEMADGHVLGVFGDLKRVKTASPTEYIGITETPMLVVSETQTYDYTGIYEEMIQSEKIEYIEFYHDRKLDHRGLHESLSGEGESPTREVMIEYILGLAE